MATGAEAVVQLGEKGESLDGEDLVVSKYGDMTLVRTGFADAEDAYDAAGVMAEDADWGGTDERLLRMLPGG